MADKRNKRIAKRTLSQEELRLEEDRRRKTNWKRWGPYLSERQWGTVREDYSADGTAWDYFPHDHARSRAYRWGEDGLGGISDRHQYICFALALWNGKDPILKERLFGLTGNEGNHGEDVKEYYFYLDSTPTHSYMKFLYKYPQAEFPYGRLVEENRQRGKRDLEFELIDTGVFDEIATSMSSSNTPRPAPRTSWSGSKRSIAAPSRRHCIFCRRSGSATPGHGAWMSGGRGCAVKRARRSPPSSWHITTTAIAGSTAKARRKCSSCENETNYQRLYGSENESPYVKDSINDYVIHGRKDAVNPADVRHQSRGALRQDGRARANRSRVRLRLTDAAPGNGRSLNGDFDQGI